MNDSEHMDLSWLQDDQPETSDSSPEVAKPNSRDRRGKFGSRGMRWSFVVFALTGLLICFYWFRTDLYFGVVQSAETPPIPSEPFGTAEAAPFNDPRLFGERVLKDGIAATEVVGLPAGLEIKAIADWGAMNSGITFPHPLTVHIAFFGPLRERVITYGSQEVHSVKTTPNLNHLWIENGQRHWLQTQITPDGYYPFHPPNGVLMPFSFCHPLQPVNSITIRVGFDIEVAESIETIVVDMDRTFPDVRVKEFRNPTLDSIRTIWKEPLIAQLEFESLRSDKAMICGMQFIHPDGMRSGTFLEDDALHFSRKINGRVRLANRIPDGSKLEITVARNLKRQQVIAEWKELPVGPSPIVSPSLQYCNLWTSADLLDAPKGMQLSARMMHTPDSFPPKETADKLLTMAITGLPVKKIRAIGQWDFKATSQGQSLKVPEREERYLQFMEGFVMQSHSSDRVLKDHRLTAPQKIGPGLLETFEGQFSIDLADSIDYFDINDIAGFHFRKTTDEALEKEGFRFHVRVEPASLSTSEYLIRVVKGDTESLASLSLLNSDDEVIAVSSPVGRSDPTVISLFQQHDPMQKSAQPVKLDTRGTKLRVGVYRGWQRHRVKFRFPKVPIP